MSHSKPQPSENTTWLIRAGRLCFWTARAFIADRVPRLGAAIAFYTTIAVAPLLVLTLAVAGIFFQEDEARQRVFGEIEELAGQQAVQALETVEPPQARQANRIATSISVVVLIFGASRVFRQLQNALNEIWRVEPPKDENWWQLVRRHVFSFGLVMTTGFVMLVSLVISAAVSWLVEQRFFAEWLAGLAPWFDFFLSLAVITFLFAIIFKLLPNAPVRWRDVWLGAVVTALLFAGGKFLLGLYLAKSTISSSYGVAGSVITLLLWTYYAAQIVLVGAEFTRIENASDRGRHAPA